MNDTAEFGNLGFNDDGSVEILISSDGLPSGSTIVPAPLMSEAEREAVVQRAIDTAYMRGWLIEGQRRIRNMVFDQPGVKTTTMLTLRTCKNKDEAEFVLSQVKRIVDAKVK